MPCKAVYLLRIGVLLSGVVAARGIQAEDVMAPHVMVCLPDERTGGLPSDEFIAAVNRVAVVDKEHKGSVSFVLIAHDQVLVQYAKIILHSYGIGGERIQTANSAAAVRRNDDHSTTRMGCDSDGRSTSTNRTEPVISIPSSFQMALVVLGNRPLDDSTPTVDMVQRILTAVPNVKGRSDTALVLTGAATEGTISEAKMMTLIALSRGVSRRQLFLEEEAWTTGRNAAFTAPIVARLGVKTVFVVSKRSHLEFAMPEFLKYDAFRGAQPLESPEVHEQSIHQMEEYLKTHENPTVRSRLEALRQDSHGVD